MLEEVALAFTHPAPTRSSYMPFMWDRLKIIAAPLVLFIFYFSGKAWVSGPIYVRQM